MRANEFMTEKWTKKYKKSIDCSHPKGFSQKAHCAGRKARKAGKKTKSKSVSETAPMVNYGIGKNPGKLVPVGKNGKVPHAKLHVNVPAKTAKKLGIPYDVKEETIKLSGFGPSEKSKEWVAKVNSMFPQSPLNPDYRLMKFGEGNDMAIVQFELKPLGKSVEVKWIQATPLRSGAGSKAMKILQDLARQDRIKLTLYAWDKGAISQAKLMKFYKKQGFNALGKSGNMEWEPN